MKIYFKTNKLKDICSFKNEAVKKLGTDRAKKLMQRMMELAAAETLSDISHLPPVRCHELTGSEAGIFSVDLEHPYRLLFIPAENPLPTSKDGGIDKKRVREIEIINIKDTH